MSGTRTSNSYPHAQASRIAEALLAELSPGFERVELAGSLRRGRPSVHDIEVVAVPRFRREVLAVPQADLFAPPPDHVQVNCLWEEVERASQGHSVIVPIKPGVPDLEADQRWPEKRLAGSRYFKLYLPRTGLKVDLFMADARTWGLVYAVRTGSDLFSKALVTRWTVVSGGGHSKHGLLHDRAGAVVATPEEEDVFAACRARWVDPRLRREAADLRAL